VSRENRGGRKRTGRDPQIARGAGTKRVGDDADITRGAGAKRTYVPPSHTAVERVCWHFGAMDFEGPYGWAGATREHLLKVIEVVRGMEKQTATEIFDAARYRQTVGASKGIPFTEICRRAQRRLREIGLDEHDLLYEIRITRRARLWCLRFSAVACLLWWDPDHLVCPRSD